MRWKHIILIHNFFSILMECLKLGIFPKFPHLNLPWKWTLINKQPAIWFKISNLLLCSTVGTLHNVLHNVLQWTSAYSQFDIFAVPYSPLFFFLIYHPLFAEKNWACCCFLFFWGGVDNGERQTPHCGPERHRIQLWRHIKHLQSNVHRACGNPS